MCLENVNIGDKLKYLGSDPANTGELTRGRIYEVVDIDGDTVVIDTVEDGSWAIGDAYGNIDCFVKVEKNDVLSELKIKTEPNVLNVEVGDKIKFKTYYTGITQGKEYEIISKEVVETCDEWVIKLSFYDDDGEEVYWHYPSAIYEVIKKDELSNEELTDLIVKLSKNLASVDKRLDTLEEREDSISNDLRTLGEEGAKTAYDVEELRGKLDEHINMFTEDISMLDERTMHLRSTDTEDKAVEADANEEHNAVSPSHYKYGDIEVIDYIDQVCRLYGGEQASYVANVIKYVSRSPLKNGAEDLRKARWYLDRLIDKTEQGDVE